MVEGNRPRDDSVDISLESTDPVVVDQQPLDDPIEGNAVESNHDTNEASRVDSPPIMTDSNNEDDISWNDHPTSSWVAVEQSTTLDEGPVSDSNSTSITKSSSSTSSLI